MGEFFTYNMLLGTITAAVISWIIIPPVVRVARKKELVAITNGRTNHIGAIPALGGIAIFAAIMVASSLFFTGKFPDEFRYIFPAIIIMFFVGVTDDLVDLKVRVKLLTQIVVAFLVVKLADIRIESFFGFMGVGELPYWFSLLFSGFVFICIVNSINLIDGIDGLASGLGMQISIVFGIWLAMAGFPNFAIFSFVLTGALFPFYLYNVFGKNYKLFMGDTGSLILGTIFAILAIKVLCCPIPPGHEMEMSALPIVVMSVLIIPIVDTLKVFVVRLINKKSPFNGDRNHLHHNLLQLRLSHRQASSVIILLNFSIFIIAYFLKNIEGIYLLVIVAGLGTSAILVPWILARKFREGEAKSVPKEAFVD